MIRNALPMMLERGIGPLKRLSSEAHRLSPMTKYWPAGIGPVFRTVADPVAPNAPGAIGHLNADHADSLLLIAKALSGHTDAEEARCVGADRYGLDLELLTARGRTGARVGFEEPATEPDGLRAATVELVRRAR